MKLLLGVAAVAVTGCAAETKQVEVRSIADPAAKLGVGSERLAEARGQLVLGNVGLAIEGFHAALREQPTSVEAMGGLAACYDSMGRTDLSRQYFEAALAVAPRNAAVLNAFAASLEAQGNRAEAMELRSEAAQASRPLTPAIVEPRLAGTAPAVMTTAALAPVAAPSVAATRPAASVTIALPPARPAASQVATVTLPPPEAAAPPAPEAPKIAATETPRAAVAPPMAALAAAPLIAAVGAVEPVAMPQSAPVVPATAVAPPVAPQPAAPESPMPPAAPRLALLDALQPPGPRLERLSLGEVALLTSREPAWQSKAVARTLQSTTVRWVALNDGPSRPNIRLLNAARSQGLAARTRAYLMALGWRKIEIGDAAEVRESSLVMYPETHHATGRSLAAQFGFRPGMSQQGETIVVLLGRDATRGRGAQARG